MPTVHVRNKIDNEVKRVELRVRDILIPKGEESDWEDATEDDYQGYKNKPTVYKQKVMYNGESYYV